MSSPAAVVEVGVDSDDVGSDEAVPVVVGTVESVPPQDDSRKTAANGSASRRVLRNSSAASRSRCIKKVMTGACQRSLW